jgi:galactonate dehydratase
MKIQTIDAFPWRGRTVLKVTAEGGLTGWGECGAVGPAALDRARAGAVGEDATRYEVLRVKIAGPIGAALTMAVVDITGKAAKAPAYQVLGGPTRTKVRAMTAWSEDAAKRGYKAFVTKVGAPLPEPFDWVVDGESRLTPGQAQTLAARLEELHPLWLDEPCPPTNLGAAKKISEESVTPIGWGRHVTAMAEVQNMLRDQMVDVVRLDIGRHDLCSIRKAAALAETYYVAVAPYHAGGPIATAAAMHLAASLPNFFIQQVPWAAGDDAKARAELVGADIETPKEGFLTLPTRPGLGIQVNEQALRRYAA